MEEVVCKSCGSVDNYKTEMKSNQNTAWCNDCGSFIKNISYAEPAFYFGKYKNILIKNCKDLEYLTWFLNETNPKSKIKTAILEQIKSLKNGGKNG